MDFVMNPIKLCPLVIENYRYGSSRVQKCTTPDLRKGWGCGVESVYLRTMVDYSTLHTKFQPNG